MSIADLRSKKTKRARQKEEDSEHHGFDDAMAVGTGNASDIGFSSKAPI